MSILFRPSGDAMSRWGFDLFISAPMAAWSRAVCVRAGGALEERQTTDRRLLGGPLLVGASWAGILSYDNSIGDYTYGNCPTP
jgi:hypothetical protein